MVNFPNMDTQALVNASVTFTCSSLSWIGSVLIILAYVVARTKSTPKTAYLILHLAISDFFWFLAGTVMSTLWLTNDGSVPSGLCYLIAPTINFTRMTSLVWTVVISFNVYMAAKKRKWFWKSQQSDWEAYQRIYYCIAFLLAAPGTLVTVIQQHTSDIDGCSPGYEKLGEWYFVFSFELLPILLGFFCNVFVFLKIRRRMSKTAFPQSVRKRRKRVMYHYITICIICWIPTIMLYILEIAGLHLPVLEIVARTSLYISGFLNFLVFGMQDPHLKRAIDVILFRLGLYAICYGENSYSSVSGDGKNVFSVETHALKSSDVDKMVMFQEDSLSKNADKPKDRNNIYKTRKLSREQKKELYAERPDLDPKFKTRRAPATDSSSVDIPTPAAAEQRKKKRLIIHDNTDSSPSNSMETPLLLDYEKPYSKSKNEASSSYPPRNGGITPYRGDTLKKTNNNTNNAGPKQSIDGERELTGKISPPSSYTNAIPIPTVEQSFLSSNASSSASGSYTLSHNLSVLSDITNTTPSYNVNTSYQGSIQDNSNSLEQMEAGGVNPAVRQLFSVVHQGEADERIEDSNNSNLTPQDDSASSINVKGILNPLNTRDLTDSLNLHSRRNEEEEEDMEEGDEEYSDYDVAEQDSKEYVEDDEDASSSEDEDDSEDEDLLNTPL